MLEVLQEITDQHALCCLDVDVPPLTVCFFRHAYGLGEHYNSVKAAEDSETGSDDEA
jgi:hypothetical protein